MKAEPKREFKWRKPDNHVSRKQLRDSLEHFSRSPFRDSLAHILQCRPDPLSIYEWACQHPDRWANAINIFAKLAGYQDTQEINVNVYDPTQLSDAHLLQRLIELRERMGQEASEIRTLEDHTTITIDEKDNKKPPAIADKGSLP